MTATLRDDDFALVRDYVAALAGLAFAQNRREVLAAVVADRLHATGLPDAATYVAALRATGGDRERERLLDAVTVHETHFFRNPPQIEALRRVVLPDLLRHAGEQGRRLTVWSAGCSTGEEAYTLAMLLVELSGGLQPAARVVATDVSASALRAARQATYAGRTLAAVPPAVRDRFFVPGAARSLSVRDEVRDLVEVLPHNLVTEAPPFGPGEVDLVVCRNVTIYFARSTTRALMSRFRGVLRPDGYLLLGHSETLWQLSDEFGLEAVGDAFVYRPGRSAVAPRLPRRRPRPSRPAPRVPPPPSTATAHARPATVDVRATVGLLDAARTALAAGDYADAARLAEAAYVAQPLLTDAYVVVGHALSTMAMDGEALGVLRKAVFLDPGHGIAHFLLGGALARLGQHSAASVSYRAAAATLPGTPRGTLDTYLGGRAVADLVEVCQRLARSSADLAAGQGPVTAGRSAS